LFELRRGQLVEQYQILEDKDASQHSRSLLELPARVVMASSVYSA
jgi:hypothetical protein